MTLLCNDAVRSMGCLASADCIVALCWNRTVVGDLRDSETANAQGQQRNYSMIPLIGGVIGTGGCLLSRCPRSNSLVVAPDHRSWLCIAFSDAWQSSVSLLERSDV